MAGASGAHSRADGIRTSIQNPVRALIQRGFEVFSLQFSVCDFLGVLDKAYAG